MHMSTVMPSLDAIPYTLNTVRYMAIVVQVCHVCDAVVTLHEEQGHRTEKRLCRPLVGLSSQQP